MDKASETLQIAAAGLRAQSARMRIIAENVANAESTGQTPDADPYRRQIPVFEAELNREVNGRVVRMSDVRADQSEFRLVYEPGHPAANDEGYVKYPNVSSLIELMDMRDAQRSYEANLTMVEGTRRMLERTLDLLRR
ncbi:flagellar basal body rod protein FlgC [Maricaulaceae bacterium EIL42A08]|nr:flagellar basal body rod protein FlgC [Maricaulaceae bacterium EIL42A08]MCP2678440.1 flagellar basal body rod protein FlgC [Maricaulaceae bacterium NA33B04]